MTVLLNALRGGPVQFKVSFDSVDYTDSLVSVTGISRKAQLDGTFTSATVTVTLYGAETTLEAGQSVQVDFMDGAAGVVHLWKGTISAITTPSNSVWEITCTGALSKLNKDASTYYPRGTNPRGFFQKALNAALPFSVSVPNYNDNYHRVDCRVSTKYTTLANLSGTASYNSPTLTSANWNGSSYSNSWSQTLSSSYHFFDLGKWSTFLDTESPSASGPGDALAWHRSGWGLECSMYSFDTTNSSTKSYWPAGQDKFYNTYFTAYKDGSNYDIMGYTYQDSNGVERVATYVNVSPSESNKDAPNQTYTSWFITANMNLHTSWTPSNATPMDSRSYKKQWSTTSGSSIRYGYMAQHQLDGEIIYNHVDCSSSLTGRISSSSNLGNRYNLKQVIFPVTIAADDITWPLAEQAAWIAAIGLVEDGSSTYGAKVVDLCPEKGSIFEVPICSSTCSGVTFSQNNPLPTSIKANLRTPWGKDYSYTVALSDVSVKSEKTIDIMQGMAKGSATVSPYGDCVEMEPSSWRANPGFCMDRWTGCGSSSGLTYNIFSSGYGVSPAIQHPDGTVINLSKNLFDSRSGYEPTSTLAVYVREKDGTVSYPFAGRAYFNPNSTAFFKDQEPWLDIYPIRQLRDASNRVFVNHLRPSWKVEVPLAFVSCEPGQVVVVDLKEIVSEPYLALVISNECSSDKPSVTLELLPMFVAVGASSSDWPNIGDVLNIATSLDSTTIGKPYIPANLLINNTQPEPAYAHSFVINSANTFAGEEWWFPLKVGESDENAKLPGNPLTPIKITARNRITGYLSEFMLTKDDWDWNYNNGVLEPQARMGKIERLSKAICGEDYQGNGLVFYQWIGRPSEYELVFNTPTLPDLRGWEITFEYNDVQPINYFETMLEPVASKWQSNKTYQSGGNHYDLPNVVDIIAARDYLVWKFDHDEWNAHDLCFFSYEASTPTTSRKFQFSEPWDGVFNDMYINLSASGNAASIRFTIAPDFRDNYSQSSQMAQAYFSSPESTESYTSNLIEGATVKLCKIVKGF